MDTKETFSQLLGLTPAWKVSDVDLDMERQRIEINVDWVGGSAAACPDCGQDCPVYDLRETRRWRHLDTMQFVTAVCCRTPRCKCPEHGVVTVKTPWADKHSRFTLMFESFAIHPITNAVTEGLNSKIQNIKASARGFRLFARYRIAILFYCGKLDMMPN